MLLKQIRQTSPRRRTRPDVLDEFELCEALSTLLPPAEAKSLRAQLRELGVRVVKIGTLFERMSYDQDVVAVQAGKPVEFVLQNSDLMPHNFVIAQPGSLEEVGLLVGSPRTGIGICRPTLRAGLAQDPRGRQADAAARDAAVEL